jgi:glycosyltransferase involved in cell wall biosynthesis
MPLRILHISTRLILGGSQENTILSCEGQARLGHRVHLAFGPIFGPEGSMRERVEAFNLRCRSGEERTTAGGEVCPIVLHEVPHLVREVSPLADWRAYGELRDLIETLSPDVVHTHSSKAGIIGRAASWSVRKAGARADAFSSMRANRGTAPAIVHTIHGPPFMPVEGSFSKRLSVRFSNAIYTLAERFAARRCQTIVSVADAMTRQFLARGIGRAEQYVTVRSGMEIEAFVGDPSGSRRASMRAELGLAPDDLVVGTVARLAEHKGHDDLLDALTETLKSRPNLKLLWVGDGWWRERLTSRCRQAGLGVRELDRPNAASTEQWSVLLTGLVEPSHVPGLIGCMNVLAHPSYREGLPRTVPQALLSKVCPVAYDVDGTGEICREMETGRLVPAGDATRLGEAILWCLDNPVPAAVLAARGHAECVTAFSASVMVESLERVYQEAMKG